MSSNYYNKLKAFLTLLAFDLEKLNEQKLYIVFNINMKIETIVASASGLLGLNMNLIIYESDAISIYNYLYLSLEPEVDEFLLLLIINRLLKKQSIETQAEILKIDYDRYFKLERGILKFTKKEKESISKKLNIYTSKEELFASRFVKFGEVKNDRKL